MESTKEQVLHLLQERGEATVATLAEALGVGSASVRRHLDHLRVDGLADVRAQRHGVGRPVFVFYPTQQAEQRVPAGYARLLSRLYKGLQGLGEQDVGGRDGSGILGSVFEDVASQVASEHRRHIPRGPLEFKVAETARVLNAEGIVDTWRKDDGGYHLTNHACPYLQAAGMDHGTCELDRRTIELLVEAPVRQVSRIADGQSQCVYVVAEQVDHDQDE
jgi:predicted ArsR family transcriptional regulator